MSQEQLSNEDFFARLSELFDSTRQKEHGSVYLTQKRLSYSPSSTVSTPTKTLGDPLWDLHPPSPLPLLIRATNGKSKKDRHDKIKLATVVQPDALEEFYTRYADVCRAGMLALKKRDRRKKAKDKKGKRKGGGGVEKKG